MQLSTKDLQQSKNWLTSAEKEALIQVISCSFNGVAAKQYYIKYFAKTDVLERKLRLYFADQQLIGYCLITFSQHDSDVLIRASAAFYPQYRQGGNTFTFSMKQAILYWLKNPRKNIFYADTMLSPAMYRVMAKKLAIIWPSTNSNYQANYLFEQFNHRGFISPALKVPCLVAAGRASNYSEQEVANFKASNKAEINFYCQINPEFDKGTALFVIIPVTLKQFVLSALKVIKTTFR